MIALKFYMHILRSDNVPMSVRMHLDFRSRIILTLFLNLKFDCILTDTKPADNSRVSSFILIPIRNVQAL